MELERMILLMVLESGKNIGKLKQDVSLAYVRVKDVQKKQPMDRMCRKKMQTIKNGI